MQQPLNVEILSQQQQQLKQNMSPKRDGRTLLSQTIIHQSYGVAQQSGGVGAGMPRQRTIMSVSSSGNATIGGILPPHLSMAYYSQPPPSQSYFGEVLHPMQVISTFPKYLYKKVMYGICYGFVFIYTDTTSIN